MANITGNTNIFKNSPKTNQILKNQGQRNIPGDQTVNTDTSLKITSWASPGTMADDSAVGTVTWIFPDKAKTKDNDPAGASSDASVPDTSHYLKATNFGFAIPTDATIEGIEVQIQERDGGGTDEINDEDVKIVLADGSIGSEDKASAVKWWAQTDYTTYGGGSDLWSETWTPANINDSDFGVVISVTINAAMSSAQVDHIQIKIYYRD